MNTVTETVSAMPARARAWPIYRAEIVCELRRAWRYPGFVLPSLRSRPSTNQARPANTMRRTIASTIQRPRREGDGGGEPALRSMRSSLSSSADAFIVSLDGESGRV